MYLFKHFSKVIKILSYLIGTSMLVLFKFILPGVALKKKYFIKKRIFYLWIVNVTLKPFL